MIRTVALVVTGGCLVQAQTYQFQASVAGSGMYVRGCFVGGNALPLGPVVSPILVQVYDPVASVQLDIAPKTVNAPLAVHSQLRAGGTLWCWQSQASFGLFLDVTMGIAFSNGVKLQVR